MTEENFLHVHQQIVVMNFQRHLTTSISFLKLNSVVPRKCAAKSDLLANSSGDSMDTVPIGTSTSSDKTSRKPIVKGNSKGKGTKKGKKPVPSQTIDSYTEDLIMLHEDIGTQTIETHFVQEQLHSMIKYMMNTIRIEDFKTEYD